MRVLFTSVVGFGHFLPMVPLAHALIGAGHVVAFATDPAFRERIETYGFETFAAGLDHAEAFAGLARAHPDLSSVPHEDRMAFVFPGMFARVRVPPMLTDLERLLPAWQPQLLIHDTAELAGAIAARKAGIAHAEHGWGVRRPRHIVEVSIREREPHVLAHGVDDPGINGTGDELYIDVCPPSLEDPTTVRGRNVQPLRPSADGLDADLPLPAWADGLGERPCVYVTLGTVSNQAVHVFHAVLDGVREEEVDVIVTVGMDGDPSALGSLPPNVHVERFLPQGAVLRRCDLMISHAGSGAMLGAAVAGVPVLAIPQAADQFLNSRAMVRAGMALRLLPDELRPETVREATHRLLVEPTFREHSQAVQSEIGRMPTPASVIPRLEELAARPFG